MFKRKTPEAPVDLLTHAREAVDRISAALAKAEGEVADARSDYDCAMHNFVERGIGKNAPSQEGQLVAEAKVESLKRLLAEAHGHLERVMREEEDARRTAAIRASGGQVDRLTQAAEEKLATLELAVAAARVAETDLLDILFNTRSGLMQSFPGHDSQRDANWSRNRLRQRAIAVGEKFGFPLADSFDADSGLNLGPLRTGLYRRTSA